MWIAKPPLGDACGVARLSAVVVAVRMALASCLVAVVEMETSPPFWWFVGFLDRAAPLEVVCELALVPHSGCTHFLWNSHRPRMS